MEGDVCENNEEDKVFCGKNFYRGRSKTVLPYTVPPSMIEIPKHEAIKMLKALDGVKKTLQSYVK
jgi:hypothetical protein